MNELNKKFKNDLYETPPNEVSLYELFERYANLDDQSELFETIFSYMEKNHSEDLGSPGPLVHFVEKGYPEYLGLLKKSLKRQPTNLTIWMLNRILNSELELDLRNELLELLKSTLIHPLADEEAKSTAKMFLKHQEEIENG